MLVPVKAFAEAKARLAPALDAGQRERLARAMAEHVVAAAAPLPVSVVCDDEDGTAPIEVTRRLLELGVAASAGHVSRTMARMARDGELERLGYGRYRLPQAKE